MKPKIDSTQNQKETSCCMQISESAEDLKAMSVKKTSRRSEFCFPVITGKLRAVPVLKSVD